MATDSEHATLTSSSSSSRGRRDLAPAPPRWVVSSDGLSGAPVVVRRILGRDTTHRSLHPRSSSVTTYRGPARPGWTPGPPRAARCHWYAHRCAPAPTTTRHSPHHVSPAINGPVPSSGVPHQSRPPPSRRQRQSRRAATAAATAGTPRGTRTAGQLIDEHALLLAADGEDGVVPRVRGWEGMARPRVGPATGGGARTRSPWRSTPARPRE